MIARPLSEDCACVEVDESSVEAARACMLDIQTARELAGIFKALSDPTRLRIISALADCELCVNHLAEALGMSQSAVSHQLSDMRRERLLRARRDGRHVYYRLDDQHVEYLYHQGLAHVRHATDGKDVHLGV